MLLLESLEAGVAVEVGCFCKLTDEGRVAVLLVLVLVEAWVGLLVCGRVVGVLAAPAAGVTGVVALWAFCCTLLL